MITFNFPLAILAILLRRFLDSFHYNIPVSATASTPNTTGIVILSSALYYLYKHLKRGTLVRIATKNRPQISNESNAACRMRESSWLLRNLRGNRSKYTVAIRQFATETMKNPEVKLSNHSANIGRIHYHIPLTRQAKKEESQSLQQLPQITDMEPPSLYSNSQQELLMMKEHENEFSVGDRKELSQCSSSSINMPELKASKKSNLNVIEIIDLTSEDQEIGCAPNGGDLARKRRGPGRKCGKRARSAYFRKLRYHDNIVSPHL